MLYMFDDWAEVKVPSSSTICRARRKVDLAMMLERRQFWSNTGVENVSIQLCHWVGKGFTLISGCS